MRRMHVGATAANLMLATTSAAAGTAFAFAPPSSSLSSLSSLSTHHYHHHQHQHQHQHQPRSTKARTISSACRRRSNLQHYATSSSENDDVVETSSSSSSFESLGLSDDMINVAHRMNWEDPTPVQQLSIPAILDMADGGLKEDGDGGGSSLWCEGPTGSGKTGGFALPLLQILMQQKRHQNNDYYNADGSQRQGQISTLILCPTRELAAQTGTVLQRLTSYLPNNKRNKSASRNYYDNSRGDDDSDDASSISIDVIYGGVPMEPQVARLAKKRRAGTNIDILVATPGRLVDVLKRSEHADPTSSALERRILDAFDEKSMMDIGPDGKNGKKRRKGGGGPKKGRRRRGPPMEASLTLNDIQEMDLDRVDDDGRATLDEMLHQLDYLVVDEADRLLGGAFKDDMDKLLSLFPNNRGDASEETKLKTLLFSATFPEQIEERVDRVLSRVSAGVPLRVSTSAAMRQRVPLSEDDDEQEDGSDKDGDEQLSNRRKKHLANTTPIKNVLPDTAPKIKHRVIRLDERDRTQALRYLLDQNMKTMDRVLVFVATRYSTEHVSRKLRRYGIPAAELHGKLDQDARERRLKAFRAGKTRVLISTDLAARGIDVEGLPVVVNYDLPRSAADFTHRTGRTGRAGRAGLAVSFVSAKSESHFDFIESKELNGQTERIEREILPGFAPDEALWEIKSAAATMSVPGATHSKKGLEHDRVFGGVKGRRKSKKDKLREAAAKAAQGK